MTTTVSLSPLQTQQALQQAQAAAQAIANSATAAVGSNQFVFFAAFDGTDNAYVPVNGDPINTAIAQLFDQVNSDPGAPQAAAYYSGVGTPGTLSGSKWYPPNVTSQSIQTALDAYNGFALSAFVWLQANPGDSVTSMIAGFSRGCAAEAIFAQMLYENGLVFTDVSGNTHMLIPPGTVGAISAALAIDPVLTGESGNMDFPPGVQNLTVVRAENEYRSEFTAADYGADNDTIIRVPGNHSDAGDAYVDGAQGLGGIYLGAYTDFFLNAGLNIQAPLPSRNYMDGGPILIHSESLTGLAVITAPWELTYNGTNDLTVSRETTSYGSPVMINENATNFTAYNSDIVIGGSGYSNNFGSTSFVLLPDSSASIGAVGGAAGKTITVNDGATLDLTSNVLTLNETIKLTQDSKVIMDVPIAFKGTIDGFVPSDTIDLKGIGIAARAALAANNMLTVSERNGNALTLQLDSTQDFSGDSFLFASDGTGGNDITIESNTQPILFTGPDELLLLSDPGNLSGTISGFFRGDSIGLAGIGAVVGNALINSELVTSIATSENINALSENKIDLNFGDGTSENSIIVPGGAAVDTIYGGPNGTGPIKAIDDENSKEGFPSSNSQIAYFNPDGSVSDTLYSGAGGTGSIVQTYALGADGSWEQTTYNGTSTYTASFSGPVSVAPIIQSGKSIGTATTYNASYKPDVSSTPFTGQDTISQLLTGAVLEGGMDSPTFMINNFNLSMFINATSISTNYTEVAPFTNGSITTTGYMASHSFGVGDNSSFTVNAASFFIMTGGGIGDFGTLTINAPLTGSFSYQMFIGTAGTINMNAATEGAVGFVFDSSSGLLRINDPSEFQAGVEYAHPGDTIEISGIDDVVSYSYVDSSGWGTNKALTINGKNGSSFTLRVEDSANSFGFSFAPDGTGGTDIAVTNAACYVMGTSLSAWCGEIRVEDAKAGDLIQTKFSGFVRIKWIGRRQIECARHPDPHLVWPVRISAGAFGESLPHRDLWLSPDHAVFVNGVLIPIKHLINGRTITQEPRDEVIYFHIELGQHDVLFAEGLPAESYLDTGDRSNFENGGQPMRLHPDFSARMWEAKGCAPLIVTGPILAAVRVRLLQRAAKLASVPRSRARTNRAA